MTAEQLHDSGGAQQLARLLLAAVFQDGDQWPSSVFEINKPLLQVLSRQPGAHSSRCKANIPFQLMLTAGLRYVRACWRLRLHNSDMLLVQIHRHKAGSADYAFFYSSASRKEAGGANSTHPSTSTWWICSLWHTLLPSSGVRHLWSAGPRGLCQPQRGAPPGGRRSAPWASHWIIIQQPHLWRDSCIPAPNNSALIGLSWRGAPQVFISSSFIFVAPTFFEI